MVSHRIANKPTHYQLAKEFTAWHNADNSPLRWHGGEWHYGDDPWSEDVVRADAWRFFESKGMRPTSQVIDSIVDAIKAVAINSELEVEFPT